jgi:hypothetical protein
MINKKSMECAIESSTFHVSVSDVISVTRYFARQLLNKLAKNYQNVEKITKFLLSAKSGLKINKTSQ